MDISNAVIKNALLTAFFSYILFFPCAFLLQAHLGRIDSPIGTLNIDYFADKTAFSLAIIMITTLGIAYSTWFLCIASNTPWALLHKINSKLLDGTIPSALNLKNKTKLPQIKVRNLHYHSIFGALWDCQLIINIYGFDYQQFDPLKLDAVITGIHFKHLSTKSFELSPDGTKLIINLESTKADYHLRYSKPDTICASSNHSIVLDKRTELDMVPSPHIILAGKTRSGKSYTLFSLLLQLYRNNRDTLDGIARSSIRIIDPKNSTLSTLENATDGSNTKAILKSVKDFEASIMLRQDYLRSYYSKVGKEVKWYEAGLQPNWLVIDEYAALIRLLPKSVKKDDDFPYSQKDFDNMMIRILTMGAEAGCFVIISTSKASTENLPTQLRDAFQNRILMRPTSDEAHLLWSADELGGWHQHSYRAGTGIFSANDGEHYTPTDIRMPDLKFDVLTELKDAATAYFRHQ